MPGTSTAATTRPVRAAHRVRRRGLRAAAVALLAATTASGAARAEGGLRKGPWLMLLRRDAVTVMVERDVPGPVTVRAWPGTDAHANPIEVTVPAAATLHEVTLRGLAPGARYRYEVTGPGLAPAGGAFATPPPGDAPFRFVLYGDTRSNPSVHAAVVRAIAADAPEFVVHTGDMIADGRDERQWQEFFDIERPLLARAPLVPVVGNHEIIRPGATGLDNFERYVHVERAAGRESGETDYVFAYGAVRLIVANAYSDWSAPEVRAWLARAIDASRREVAPDEGFVLLAMHWGPRSSGPHGDNRLLHAAGIDALLRRHPVDVVVSGHDHAYERGDDDGLRYVVTGGGGAPVYAQARARESTLAFAPEHHYVRVDVARGRMEFTAVRLDGSTLERCALRHARGWTCAPGPAIAPWPSGGVVRAGLGGAVDTVLIRWCPGRGPAARSRGALAVAALLAVMLWAMARRPRGGG